MNDQPMNAVVCPAYGPPEVLRLVKLKKPTPKDNEVLVKVMATAVNSGDVRVRGLVVKGFLRIVMRVVLGFTKPRKPVLGTVLSGIVEAVGENVIAFKPGDEVMATTGFRFGAYAGYITLPSTGNMLHKPVNASFEEAAAILFGGMTALYFLQKAGIEDRSGQKVLIYGATGAVGSSAVQIARHYGAIVTAVCSEEGVALATSLGSDEVIIYTQRDFTKLEQRFDIVLDAVGKTKKSDCRSLLLPGGRYLTVGGLDVAKETKAQLAILKQLYEQGELRAVIDKTYPLREIVEAHRYVDTGRKKGNVVITVEH